MAEALVAIGVAANVVQLLEFGSRFVSSCWEIYTAGQDGVGEIPDLHAITKDFEGVVKDLKQSDAKSLPGEDSDFQPLLAKCQDLAGQLSASISKLNLPEKARKRDAVKEAIKRLWNDEISSLQIRLERLRQELIVHLLGLIRRQGQKSLEQQESLQAQIRIMNDGGRRVECAVGQLLDSQAGIGDAILRALMSHTNKGEQEPTVQRLQGDLMSAMNDTAVGDESINARALLVSSPRKQHLQNIFLARLRYHNMEDREGRISAPYEKTFRWIFEDGSETSNSWSNFKDWLESDSNLYWLTGKAGSGKSTLMKFICQSDTSQNATSATGTNFRMDRRCDVYLRNWAGDLPLVFASFYFWNSGDPLQMSRRGLFLTLLAQIVEQCPDIIATMSPVRWESLCLFNEDPRDFRDTEMQEMLRSAIEWLCSTMKICLFIDGLDEFEGKQQDLISLIMEIVAYPNVKVCVASRPWVEFQDAFDHRPNLLLQDLTYLDRKDFVVTTLERDSNYEQLRKREPVYAGGLVENIVSKSDGVFLWVNLVVKSLLAGMNNGDRVADLQRRLDALPSDLKRLYDKILENLDPFYLEHAAQLFKMVQESLSPPPLLLLYFADEVDLASAIKRPVDTVDQSEMCLRLDTMQRRLNSRCRGLLEVSPGSYLFNVPTVQYLHRTVRDYISSERAQRTLQIAPTSHFSPHENLCAGSLLHLKTSVAGRKMDPFVIHESVSQCFYSATRLQSEIAASTISVLDELRAVVTEILTQRNFNLPQSVDYSPNHENVFRVISFVRNRYDIAELSTVLLQRYRPFSFINQITTEPVSVYSSLAVFYGAIQYLQARVVSQMAVTSSLLMDAVYCFILRTTDSPLDIMRLLLAKGANPNFPICRAPQGRNNNSTWLMTLRLAFTDSRGRGEILSARWHDVVKLMIEHGATGEECFVSKRDPLGSIKKCGESQMFAIKSDKPWFPQAQSIFQKDTMRFSKALELDEHLEANLSDWWTNDMTEGLKFHNQIQKIRREVDKGKPSNLPLSWGRMKYKSSR